jgi:ribosomal protein S18 acetylase RimI-like enzyme
MPARENPAVATRSAIRVDRLKAPDLEPLRRLLDRDPVQNVYLRSELRLGIEYADWWGVRDGDHLRAALLAGSLAVPSLSDAEDAARLADTACVEQPPRMFVGPREPVIALRDALLRRRSPRDVRDPQPLLALTSAAELVDVPTPVRRATRDDIEALTIAAASMHREEMGDPLPVDPAAWRGRMTALVDLGWSWVWMERGSVVFKAELSAWTAQAVQIQGVFTHPGKRRRGVATAALSQVCRTLLAQVPVCSLYVNHENDAALRLYASLGFHRAGDFASVFY